MTLLSILFVVLFIVSVTCTIAGAMDKRKNIGFLIVSAINAIGDLFCVPLIGAQDIKAVSKYLLPYFILHAWFLFAFLVMVILIDRYRQWMVCLILSAGLCIYQTYLVISQYLGARIFSFQRRIFFRKAFWVAVDSKNTGLLFSYRSYRIAGYVNTMLLLIVLIGCICYSHKIFRVGYISLILIVMAYSVVETLRIRFLLPVWIVCAAYNVISVLCLYFTNRFARDKLCGWSFESFANDMSDGLILYDKHDDLIHVNDMIKNTLPKGLLADFADKNKLQDWAQSIHNRQDGEPIAYQGIDGEHYFRVTVRELGGNGAHIGTLYILHDATNSIRRLQAIEEVNEELERASRMKSDFLANMSHEIRTPMNAVIGMAELAIREKDSPLLEDYLLQIQSSGKNLLNIINDILDYSKIESGKMEILEEEYEPYEELAEIAGVLGTRIGDKPLELFFVVDTALPHKLLGDAMRIRQVIINLANNAIKFTAQGMVQIILNYEPDTAGKVNMLCHVIDTGIGIKKEDLDKLFVSFQQLDSRRNRSVEGTGLGLAISQRLVEAMDGKIGVESEYGKGSDFWFWIPQTVVDDTDDLVVEDAEGKYAYAFGTVREREELFLTGVKRLGVKGQAICGLEEYKETGKKEFLFMEQSVLSEQVLTFLEQHPKINGMILAEAAFTIDSKRENLHIVRKPATTMNIARMLNERFDEIRQIDTDKVFKADFVAPQAKILVVDDNPINLTIAEGLMAPLKIRPDTAGSGQSAVDQVKAKAYDIVFMDHMMPQIDGVDATRMIREAGEDIHQPVIIALSANVMEEARRLFTKAGMNDFVGKPIDIRQLTGKIKAWLPQEKILPYEEDEAQQTKEQSAQESLPRLAALDTEAAVSSLGSPALYQKIAKEYYRSGEERLAAIQKSFEEEDWENYIIRVHALKSSSRQIGAFTLGDMAEALEKAGKEGAIDTILADTQTALTAFKQLLKELAPYYEKDGEKENGADLAQIDRETFEQLLKELEENCNDLDMDGMEHTDDALKGYGYAEEIRDQMEALHKAVADIDTEACLQIIEKLRQSWE